MLDSFGIYLYIFCLSLVHLTGFFIFFSYYISQKQFRYLLFSVGWLLSLIGTMIFLIPFYMSEIRLFSIYIDFLTLASITGLLSGLLGIIGTFFISLGLLSHFFSLKKIEIYLITLIITIIPIFAFLIKGFISFDINLFQETIFYFRLTSNSLSSFLTSIEQMFVYLFLFLIGLKFRLKILQYSTVSYVLYMTGVFLSFLTLVLVQFREFQIDELAVLFNFTMSIWVAIVLMLFLIHLEHNKSMKEKYLLKDRYSHNMAQFIQLAMGNLDLLRETKNMDYFQKLENNLSDTADLLKQIRNI
ncbi:MAG: hypothetical protein HeimC3_26730 [Candidatus Heimdallarchaeota archaeon LC_3]|nr:MAG: hypothetical protein HeimC3_26730 [Candidatus Heimdallarchaeota archaeon LC_3]